MKGGAIKMGSKREHGVSTEVSRPRNRPLAGGPRPRPGCPSLPSAHRACPSGQPLPQSRCWPFSVLAAQRCWEAGAELDLSPEVSPFLLSSTTRNR